MSGAVFITLAGGFEGTSLPAGKDVDDGPTWRFSVEADVFTSQRVSLAHRQFTRGPASLCQRREFPRLHLVDAKSRAVPPHLSSIMAECSVGRWGAKEEKA